MEAYLSPVFDTLFLKPHILLHELYFRPHDASESAHQNLIFLKPLYRVVEGAVHRNPRG